MKRVVVTGMSGISALGNDWPSIKARLLTYKNAVQYMPQWEIYDGLHAKLAAPILDFSLPKHITRKQSRSMGRVAQLAVVASEQALQQAGLIGQEVLSNGETGVAYGSSTGSTAPIKDFGGMLTEGHTRNITGQTYVQMMPYTTAANISIYFGAKGRIIPTSTACTSGSQAIGYAFEAIKHGYQTIMIAGGAEELCPTEVAVFDTLYATSQANDRPHSSPRPFDRHRDGLVIGEGAATLILEEREHALARGATIHAEIIGFGSNADASHVTQPRKETMQICMQQALNIAGIAATDIGYISAHGTATQRGDIAESLATAAIFGATTPTSSLKSYFGHTLGACGALEAWLSIAMMQEDAFTPTINLSEVDPECGQLDYIMHETRTIHTNHIMSNNFAFGGVNTSLIFKRY